jgi:glycosyltransferase involved in cell wall biosynthesis
MTELAICTRYGDLAGSSRLRFMLYEKILRGGGFETHFRHFFDNDYVRRLYDGRGKSVKALFSGFARRRKELKSLPPEMPKFIEYELFPYLPYFYEKGFLHRSKYVLNFDDAVDLRYRCLPLLCRKYPRLLSNAAGVIVANDELFARYSRYNENIIKIPTVPPPLPEKTPPPEFDSFTLAWIGTPVTYPFLQELTPVLQLAAKSVEFEVLVIARKELPPLPGIKCRCVDWSAENEHALLQQCHAGIMPLNDSPFARGKSAYKLIQYLQAGIPAVASPVGENKSVISENRTGFLAHNAAEWISALKHLSAPENRRAMAPYIAAKAQEFSLETWGKTLCRFLHAALD